MKGRFSLEALARAFLAGEQTADAIASRAARMLGRNWRWLGPLARRYLEAYAGKPRPRERDAVRFLRSDSKFREAWSKYHGRGLVTEELLHEPQAMQPVEAAVGWNLPAIESTGDLAAWLGLPVEELEWLADLWALAYKQTAAPRLAHYNYEVLAKQSGKLRLIESPKTRLKELQRKILSEMLERIPSHPAAHGFVKGRSIRTFTAAHTGQAVILKMDLENFFPSISGARIQTFFRMAGYPEKVADLLGGICTNATPRNVWSAAERGMDRNLLWETRALYGRPHLPQGAPTSPALANFCAYRIDCRLAGLAKTAGAVYTRYADDLAFSGGPDFARRAERFSIHAAAIIDEEGFQVNHRKTRIMRQGVRQHLAGLVVNQRQNVRRDDFDRLKAILTNCLRRGPESQNHTHHSLFRAHLEGKVAFVESINPAKGRRLRSILNQILWTG